MGGIRSFCVGLTILSASPLTFTHAQMATPPPSMAYYIAEFEPTVPGAIQPYSASVESTFRPFGGRFIVRGGGVELLEGMPPSGRLVIIAFDSVDQARAWYNSPAYEAIKLNLATTLTVPALSRDL